MNVAITETYLPCKMGRSGSSALLVEGFVDNMDRDKIEGSKENKLEELSRLGSIYGGKNMIDDLGGDTAAGLRM